MVLALAAIAAAAVYYVRYIAPYETTDDAFIESYVTFVSPACFRPGGEVAGHGQPACQGGGRAAGNRSARLPGARGPGRRRSGRGQQPCPAGRSASRRLTRPRPISKTPPSPPPRPLAGRAEADRLRYESVESKAVSRSQLDLAKTQASSAAAEVEVARNQARAAAAQVELDRANVETARAQVQQAQTRLQQAQLQLSYTTIDRAAGRARHAPHGGAGRLRPNRPGAAGAGAGRPLGGGQFQGDAIGADASRPAACSSGWMPIRITNSRGRWTASRPARGRVFSLLPPENAVGNYVKVVQRVPVKIIFDQSG